MKIADIIVPLLNANEPEAVIVTVHGKNGSFVKKGDVIYTIETTKATSEVVSPADGYLQLKNKVGEIVKAGEPLAFLMDKAEDTVGALCTKMRHINQKKSLLINLQKSG